MIFKLSESYKICFKKGKTSLFSITTNTIPLNRMKMTNLVK